MYIKLYIKVLSKKLTIINKCTLLDCTNTWILMYCIPTVHAFGLLLLIHTLFLVQTHIHDVSTPCSNLDFR